MVFWPQLTKIEVPIFEQMKAWDYMAEPGAIEPSIYLIWWNKLETKLYKKVFGPKKGSLYPKTQVTAEILDHYLKENKDFSGQWMLRELEKTSSLPQAVTNAFQLALEELKTKQGVDKTKWRLGRVVGADIDHLLNLPALSESSDLIGGSKNAVNANFGEHGASWRQIVKLGEKFQAKTNYPGGQSGNPFDPQYDKYIKPWAKGEYRDVHYYQSWDEVPLESEL